MTDNTNPQDAAAARHSDTREAWHDAALQHVDSPDPMTRLGASVVALGTSLDENDATRAAKLRSLLDDFSALAALSQDTDVVIGQDELPCSCCGTMTSTHPEAGQLALAHCGDCGGVTCGDCREESGAQRCSRCSSKDEGHDARCCGTLVDRLENAHSTEAR